jgi:serine/threonine-protein kinase RsbW
MADTAPNELDEFIELLVPLRNKYASTIRVLAASLGADVGFSVDEIDDLRLGLSEVFSLLVEQGSRGVAAVRFRIEPDRLTIRVTPPSMPVHVAPDDLAATILSSVVDSYSFEPDAITLVKRAVEAA